MTANMPTQPLMPQTGDEIAPGILRLSLEGVTCYQFMQLEGASITFYADHICEQLRAAPGSVFAVIHDFSQLPSGGMYIAMKSLTLTSLALTPEGTRRVEQTLHERPDLRVFLATVVNPTLSGKTSSLMAKLNRGENQQAQHKFAYNLNAALRWINNQRRAS